ncbi:MAG: S41 family peptidase [Gemmatimonadota bacterium]
MRRAALGLAVIGFLCQGHRLSAQSAYEQLQTFSGVLNQIRQNYVDSIGSGDLVRAAIEGMLGSLDPHSYFLSREDGMRQLAYRSGQLAGLGIVLSEIDGLPTVQAVLPESPAAKAGIASGDRLIQVNDTVVVGISFQRVQGLLVGDRGSTIRMMLERGNRWEPDSFKLTLKFAYLEPHSVTVSRILDPTTGYVRLQQFLPDAGKEVEDAIRSLQSRGAARLIFDLRGNPGGLVSSAVEIASIFLPNGTVVFRTDGRRRSARQEYSTSENGRFTDLPLILLIDEGSASASEALAGSLQDHDRALILGRRSFGKALMQRAFEVPPAGDLVWLTVGHIVTPSGRYIQRRYQGLQGEQYYFFAGQSGAKQDTTVPFHTDHGRLVRGGGGIVPDVTLPGRVPLPIWFSVAADSGFYEAIADSVAGSMDADEASRVRFTGNPTAWQARLVDPFLARVRTRLQVAGQVDSLVTQRIGRILADRVVEVRWGPEARDQFLLQNDADVMAAMGYFPRVLELLKGPGNQ